MVVTYDPETRVYHIDKVAGECVPAPDVDGVTHTRKVDWKRSAPRDRLSMSSRNSLGSFTTIFNISADVADDLNAAAGKDVGKPVPDIKTGDSADDEEARFATYDDGIERIKDRALPLIWEDMEQFAAGLLRTMGYHATVTPKGRLADAILSPRPMPSDSSPRALWSRSNTARTWSAPRWSAHSSAAFAPVIAACTYPPAASAPRPATRQTARPWRYDCSTSMNSSNST